MNFACMYDITRYNDIVQQIFFTGVLAMKRYLTTIFLLLSIIILVIGLRMDVRWNGIASWGLSFISLLFAAYFTKYIPNKKENSKDK